MLGAHYSPCRVVAFALLIALAAGPSANSQPKHSTEIVPSVGHSGAIRSVAISSDGSRVLSASEDSTLKLWDASSGRLLRTFEGHKGYVRAVAFFRDGRELLSGGDDGKIMFWDAATGEVLRTYQAEGKVYSLALSLDQRFIVSADFRDLQVWDAKTGHLLRRIRTERSVNSVVISRDGKRVACNSEKDIFIWEMATGRLLLRLEGHSDNVRSLAFSPDGKQLVSGGDDKSVKLWDATDGKLIRSEEQSDRVESVAFSPDGKLLAAGGFDRRLTIREASSGTLHHSLTADGSVVRTITFSADSSKIVSGAMDRRISLWDATSGRRLLTLRGQAFPSTALAFTPNGERLATASYGGFVRLWDMATGQQAGTIGQRPATGEGDGFVSIAYSNDGALLLAGNLNNLKLWDAKTGKLVRTIDAPLGIVSSVAFSPDRSQVVAGGSDFMVGLWDARTGRLVPTFEGHTGDVTSVAFSPAGTTIASAGRDGTLRLWDARTGKLVRSFDKIFALGGRSIAFSPDGATIAAQTVAADGALALLDIKTGVTVRRFEGEGSTRAVAFSGDGARLIECSDRTIKIWETATGRLVQALKGHLGDVTAAVYSPDQRRIASIGNDGTTRIWSAETGAPSLVAMGSLQRDEWLAMTPNGFFTAPQKAADFLSVVRGQSRYGIAQMYQSLFNPDLVREALAGDPGGEFEQAARVLDLSKLLDTGPPPAVKFVMPADHSESNAETITVEGQVTHHGKGIGRIEWRQNGVTVAVVDNSKLATAKTSNAALATRQQLSLEPGENDIELIAYNRGNLLASESAHVTIKFTGTTASAKPTLHVLAIGIDAYRSKLFSRLQFAAHDARTFAETITKSAGGVYDSVSATVVLDEEVTPVKLDAVFEKLGREVQPRDTFILFVSAHGYSQNGRFYLIPQDYPDSLNDLSTRAISQERLQDWIANRIKARKALILLDTCESGALVAGHTQSRLNAPATDSAVGRLHEATGRPVLTAAASGKAAFEGYKNHGVFTWALLDALRNGDTNDNGTIELTELVRHVQNLVPKVGAELGSPSRGFAVVGPTAMSPSATSQAARFGSRGEDFIVARRVQ